MGPSFRYSRHFVSTVNINKPSVPSTLTYTKVLKSSITFTQYSSDTRDVIVSAITQYHFATVRQTPLFEPWACRFVRTDSQVGARERISNQERSISRGRSSPKSHRHAHAHTTQASIVPNDTTTRTFRWTIQSLNFARCHHEHLPPIAAYTSWIVAPRS